MRGDSCVGRCRVAGCIRFHTSLFTVVSSATCSVIASAPARRRALPRAGLGPAARPHRHPPRGPRGEYRALADQDGGEPSEAMRERVDRARGYSATASPTGPASTPTPTWRRATSGPAVACRTAPTRSYARTSPGSRSRHGRIIGFGRSRGRSRTGRGHRAPAETRERGDSISESGPAGAGVGTAERLEPHAATCPAEIWRRCHRGETRSEESKVIEAHYRMGDGAGAADATLTSWRLREDTSRRGAMLTETSRRSTRGPCAGHGGPTAPSETRVAQAVPLGARFETLARGVPHGSVGETTHASQPVCSASANCRLAAIIHS